MTPSILEPGATSEIETDIVVLLPVYNDWGALKQLLPMLDRELQQAGYTASLLIVDDGSTATDTEIIPGPCHAIQNATLLTLRRNVGHQRAITIGLAYAEKQGAAPIVVVMDADGEDNPSDVPRLVKHARDKKGTCVVFAERTRRTEGVVFRICYRAYQVMHLLLTGIRVRVGNFSVVPMERLSSLVTVPEMWNHYAAAVFKSQVPYETIPTRRAHRLAGRSKMNFVRLVIHGLSALSVHGELIGVRVTVIVSLAMAGLALTLLGASLVHWLLFALPSWALISATVLTVLLFHVGLLTMIFVFVILQTRVNANFLPSRDFEHFVLRATDILTPSAASQSVVRERRLSDG